MTTVMETALTRRGGDNQVLGSSGKPLLVIVEGKDIDAMVDAGLEAIEGLGRVIGDYRHILLKPNTNQRDPFPSITAPETLRAVARHCQAAGAERVVVHEDHKYDLALYYDPSALPGMELQLSQAPHSGDYVLVEHPAWHGDLDPETEFQGMVPPVTWNGCRRPASSLPKAPACASPVSFKTHRICCINPADIKSVC